MMRLWGAVVRELWEYKCAFPGCKEGPLEAHHLISRRYKLWRHDPRNGVLLCRRHHEMGSKRIIHWLERYHPVVTMWYWPAKRRLCKLADTMASREQLEEVRLLISRFGATKTRSMLYDLRQNARPD